MKRITMVLALALGLTALTGGVAFAQEAPKPVDITVGKACGVVTLTFANPNSDVGSTVGFRWNAVKGNVATGDDARTGTVTVGPKETKKETIKFPEDEFGGVAAVTVDAYFGANGFLNPKLEIYPVDTNCGAVTTPPTTTTPPPLTVGKAGDVCTCKDGVDKGEAGKLNADLKCVSNTPGNPTTVPVPTTTPAPSTSLVPVPVLTPNVKELNPGPLYTTNGDSDSTVPVTTYGVNTGDGSTDL